MVASLPVRARAELLLRQRQGIASPPDLVQFVARMYPGYVWNWHHRLIAELLEQVLAGEVTRLLVALPPRHGKTQLVSRLFPAYVLGRDPSMSVISCSYSAALATRNSREVQRLLSDPRYRAMFPATRLPTPRDTGVTRTADYFELLSVDGRVGSYRAAGVGGSITGMGFRLGIIDDPIKDRSQADSAHYRDLVWEWYTSTFRTRAEPGARIVVISTRWHQDDLVGRLLQNEPGQWEELRLPAIAEGELHPRDPRQPGEALWPERYPIEELQALQRLSAYDWAALYQQRPVPRGGGLFKEEWLTQSLAPPCRRRVWAWDLASKALGDWSAGALVGETDLGYHVLRVERLRGDYPDIKRCVLRCWAEDPADALLVEDAAAGVPLVQELRASTPLPVIPVRPQGPKISRAMAVSPLVEARRVSYSPGDWNAEFLAEFCAFPSSPHDDQVDAVVMALTYLSRQSSVSVDYVRELLGLATG